jgi:hypothetical protein
MRSKLKLLLIFIISVFPLAAHTTDYEVTADSCEYEDINTMIADASSTTGDTTLIHVPIGNCTWTSSLTIPSNKTIYLTGGGSGTDGTVITLTGSYQLVSNSANSVITGFRFLQAQGKTGYSIVIRNIGWRIHGNYFGHVTPGVDTRGSMEAIFPTGDTDGVTGRHPSGLIDNNTFVDQRIVVVGESSYGTMDGVNAIWSQDNVWGTADDTVYIENNLFKDRLSGNIMDSNMAAKYVFRFNTVSSGTNVMVHSLQGPAERGGKTWEIYNNDLNLISEYNSLAFLRAGTGFAFNNTATFSSSYYSNTSNIFLDNVRSEADCTGNCYSTPARPEDAGICNGGSSWDGNILSNGWPCRDQIGRGKDTGTDESVIGKATSSEPAYFWNNYNLTGSKNIPIKVKDSVALQIVADRDFYDYNASFDGTSGVGKGLKSAMPDTCTKSTDTAGGPAYWATDENKLYRCTDTNTWTLHYTPYTCPHPLADPTAQGSCDYSKAGTAGYTLDGGVADTTAPTVTISTSNSTIITDSLTVTGTSTDAVGVSGCKFRIGSAPDASNGTACTGTTSFSCATSGYASGANTIYVGCYDAAGNYGSDSITVTFIPPTISGGISISGGSIQ